MTKTERFEKWFDALPRWKSVPLVLFLGLVLQPWTWFAIFLAPMQ